MFCIARSLKETELLAHAHFYHTHMHMYAVSSEFRFVAGTQLRRVLESLPTFANAKSAVKITKQLS